MNVHPDSSTDSDAEGAANTDGAETPVKPVRRRRTVKAVEDAPATVDAAPDAQASGSEEPVVPAPKPRRKRAVAAAPDAASETSTDSPAELKSTAEAKPQAQPAHEPASQSRDIQSDRIEAAPVATSSSEQPRAEPTHAAEPNPIQPTRSEESSNSEPGAANAVSQANSGDGTESSAEQSAPAAGTGDGESGPEGFNDGPRGRRRGRRDRHRGDRGGESQSGEATGEAGAPVQAAPPVQAGELFAHVLSGEFDAGGEAEVVAEPAEEDPAVAKRVLLAEPDAPKLHKVLAQSGIGSRRDMEDLIADGHVTVNGEPAHVGQRVSFGDQVKVNGKPVRLRIVPPPPRIIAYHKPVGEIVTNDDPQNRPTVFRRLPRLQQGKWQSVGRLDINTEGLLLFTNSGELANQLMHPRFGVEREYAVRVLGTCTEENKEALLSGVDVEGQKASFRSIVDGGGDGANHWYRVVITEGRNREVRKLFDTVGLTVSRLIRIRYGTVVLPLGLKRGVWVDLEEGDVRAIRRLASGDNGQRDGQGGRGNEPREQRPNQGGQQQRGDGRNDTRGNRPNDRNRNGRRNDGNQNQPMPQAFAPDAGEAQNRGGDSDDFDMDFDPASIPNPLEQTFDKRFVQNPRSPAGGRGFRNGGGGFGAGGSAPVPANPKRSGPGGGPKQPDPLQTSLGVFGADAFHRKNRGGGGGGGGGGGRGGNRGGGGGFGGGGGNFGGGGGGRKGGR